LSCRFSCLRNQIIQLNYLPRHDLTGGNYWFASMSQYHDSNGTLLVGGGLTGHKQSPVTLKGAACG